MNPLFHYLLKIADDALIFAQRLGELCGRGPYLEEDIAATNIALDYLGQSSNFYKYAAQVQNLNRTEDDLAFLRQEKEYLNCQLTELPNGDYAQTMLKIYFFSVYLKVLFGKLAASSDENLAALAKKSLKEAKYHYTHSATWIQIFANGTEESREKILKAVENLWEYTGGLFAKTAGEEELVSIGMVPAAGILYDEWKDIVAADFNKFHLPVPAGTFMQKGSRTGYHTEYFGYILCELQYMQRTYPNCSW